jgi:hypothetical protein
MSGKLVSLILQKDIPAAKLLAVALASHCHGESLTCWPSVELLAYECQTTQRQIYKLLSQLKRLGYVTSKRAGPRPIIFTLHPEKMPTFTPELRFRSDIATPELQDSLDLNPSSFTPELQDSRNKEEPERTGKSNRKSFVPPALTDIEHYCRVLHNTVDAEKFVAYYQANGWRVGRNPMKDWQAAVRLWERNQYSYAVMPSRQQQRTQRNRETIMQALLEHQQEEMHFTREEFMTAEKVMPQTFERMTAQTAYRAGENQHKHARSNVLLLPGTRTSR